MPLRKEDIERIKKASHELQMEYKGSLEKFAADCYELGATAEAEKANELVEALEGLNETLDAYWNASLKNDLFIKKITAKQQIAKQALDNYKK